MWTLTQSRCRRLPHGAPRDRFPWPRPLPSTLRSLVQDPRNIISTASSEVLAFGECSISGIIQHVTIWLCKKLVCSTYHEKKINVGMLLCIMELKTFLCSLVRERVFVSVFARNSVDTSTGQQIYYVSHVGAFKFSSSHVKKLKRALARGLIWGFDFWLGIRFLVGELRGDVSLSHPCFSLTLMCVCVCLCVCLSLSPFLSL